MFNARRSTSLTSLGVLAFAYHKNAEWVEPVAEDFGLESEDAANLLELLTQDAVFSGAISSGKEYLLNAAEREYIFFTPYFSSIFISPIPTCF